MSIKVGTQINLPSRPVENENLLPDEVKEFLAGTGQENVRIDFKRGVVVRGTDGNEFVAPWSRTLIYAGNSRLELDSSN